MHLSWQLLSQRTNHSSEAQRVLATLVNFRVTIFAFAIVVLDLLPMGQDGMLLLREPHSRGCDPQQSPHAWLSKNPTCFAMSLFRIVTLMLRNWISQGGTPACIFATIIPLPRVKKKKSRGNGAGGLHTATNLQCLFSLRRIVVQATASEILTTTLS